MLLLMPTPWAKFKLFIEGHMEQWIKALVRSRDIPKRV